MTSGDKAEIKEMAREIVKEVLIEHVAVCPHGMSLKILTAKMVGIGVGIGVASGGTMFGLAKLFGIFGA